MEYIDAKDTVIPTGRYKGRTVGEVAELGPDALVDMQGLVQGGRDGALGDHPEARAAVERLVGSDSRRQGERHPGDPGVTRQIRRELEDRFYGPDPFEEALRRQK